MIKCKCGSTIFSLVGDQHSLIYDSDGHNVIKELWQCDQCEAFYVWYYKLVRVVPLVEAPSEP